MHVHSFTQLYIIYNLYSIIHLLLLRWSMSSLAQHFVIGVLALTLEVTNDNFHGVHRLELYIVAFKKNHCITNTGHKNINKIPLCC